MTARTFTYRASLSLIDATGQLALVAESDIATMEGGELDAWLESMVETGQLRSGWQWSPHDPDGLIDESGAVIGQCVAEPVTFEQWGGRRSF